MLLLLLLDRPERPVITGVQNVTSESVVLQWVEPHHNNAPILGFYIYTCGDLVGNVTADEDSLNVTGLMPDTEYVFTVIAFNSIGISQPSTSFIVTTLEAGKVFLLGLNHSPFSVCCSYIKSLCIYSSVSCSG